MTVQSENGSGYPATPTDARRAVADVLTEAEVLAMAANRPSAGADRLGRATRLEAHEAGRDAQGDSGRPGAARRVENEVYPSMPAAREPS